MSRFFSSTARSFLSFSWKGTEPVSKYEKLIKEGISKDPKLAKADVVEIA